MAVAAPSAATVPAPAGGAAIDSTPAAAAQQTPTASTSADSSPARQASAKPKTAAKPDTAEMQTTARQTTPSEARRLDAATRIASRQGASTRDTERTGAVSPPPATRKTAAQPARSTQADTMSAARAETSAAPAETSATAAASRDTLPPAPRNDSAAAGAGGAQPAAPSQQGGDKLVASPAAYQGWKTFHVYCYRCHGTDALGSDIAPNLRHSVSPEGSVTREVFFTTVKEGRVDKGMPAWANLLTDEQIANLYAYVKARSDGSLAAGRPRQQQSN